MLLMRSNIPVDIWIFMDAGVFLVHASELTVNRREVVCHILHICQQKLLNLEDYRLIRKCFFRLKPNSGNPDGNCLRADQSHSELRWNFFCCWCFFSSFPLHAASFALTSAPRPPAVVSQRPPGHRAPSSPPAPPPQESPQTAAQIPPQILPLPPSQMRREAPRGFASLPPQASEIPETPERGRRRSAAALWPIFGAGRFKPQMFTLRFKPLLESDTLDSDLMCWTPETRTDCDWSSRFIFVITHTGSSRWIRRNAVLWLCCIHFYMFQFKITYCYVIK